MFGTSFTYSEEKTINPWLQISPIQLKSQTISILPYPGNKVISKRSEVSYMTLMTPYFVIGEESF